MNLRVRYLVNKKLLNMKCEVNKPINKLRKVYNWEKNLLISAFDNFNFGFIICAHGKIEYLNKKLSELINIPRHKLKNKECDDVRNLD